HGRDAQRGPAALPLAALLRLRRRGGPGLGAVRRVARLLRRASVRGPGLEGPPARAGDRVRPRGPGPGRPLGAGPAPGPARTLTSGPPARAVPRPGDHGQPAEQVADRAFIGSPILSARS